MLRRVTHVLIAFVVALAMTMPAGVSAMPMPAGTMGKAVDQPCQKCPQPHPGGSTNPDKMSACQALGCISTPAVLPSPILTLGRVLLLRAAHVRPPAVRWSGADPAPDPFPPRPFVLL